MARSVNGHNMGLSLAVSENKSALKANLDTSGDQLSPFQEDCFSEVDSIASTSSKGRNTKNGSFSSYEGSASDLETTSVKANGRCRGKRKRKLWESEFPEKHIRTRHSVNLSRHCKNDRKTKVNLKISKKTRCYKKESALSRTSELLNNNVSPSHKDYCVISENQNSKSTVHHSLIDSSLDIVNVPTAIKQNLNEENEVLSGAMKIADSAKDMTTPEKLSFDESSDSLAATSMKQALEKKLKKIIDSPDTGSKSLSATNLITTLSEKLSSKLANAVTRRSTTVPDLPADGITEETTPEKNKMQLTEVSQKSSPFFESLKNKVSLYSPLSKWKMSPKAFSDEIGDSDLSQKDLKENPTELKLKHVSHPLLLRESSLMKRSGKSNVYDTKKESISITKKYNYINFENETPSTSTDNSREQDEIFLPAEDKIKSPKKKNNCNSPLQKNVLLSENDWNDDQCSEIKFDKSITFDSEAQAMELNSSGIDAALSGVYHDSKPESQDRKPNILRKELEILIQESKLKEFPIKTVKKSRLRKKPKKKKTEYEMLLQSLSETKDPLPSNPKRKRTEKNALSEKSLRVKLSGSQNNLNTLPHVNNNLGSSKNPSVTTILHCDTTISQSSPPSVKSKASKHIKKIHCKLIKKSSALSSKKIKVNKSKNKKLNTPLIAKRKNAIKVQLNLEKKKKLEKQLNSKENNGGVSLVTKSPKLGTKSKPYFDKGIQRKDVTVNKPLARKSYIQTKLNAQLKINKCKDEGSQSSSKTNDSSGITFKNVKHLETLGSWSSKSTSDCKPHQISNGPSSLFLKQAQQLNLNSQSLTVTIPVTPLRSIDIAKAMHFQPKKISKRKASIDLSKRISIRQSESSYRYKGICVKVHENFFQIILLTGNNNSRNALNPQILKELKLALNSSLKDASCKIVLLNGTGSLFCTGIDLKYLIKENKETRYKVATDMIVALKGFLNTLLTFPKPIVVAVNGIAVGLGVTLLPLCDIIYASDKATFLTPYAKLCQIPEGGATCTFPQMLDMTTANELLLGGRRLTAEEASKCGLVSQVFWPSKFLEEVIPRVQIMASQNGKAMQATKSLLRNPLKAKLEEAIENECKLLLEQWCSTECQRAMKQFLEMELL